LMATAPTAEARFKQLSKAMVEFRGWRRADYHAESMALEKENSKWRRERETQELDLKKQALELQRARYQRSDAEYLVKACNDPKMRAVAENDELSYAEQVRAARIFMFGDDDEPEVGSQGSDAANGEKTTVESQGLAGSEGVSGTQKNKPVSNMSDAERKAFYEAYLGMLLDLNAAGEDLREIDGFNDAENKHAALKAKQEEEEEEDEENIEHPTSNIQHPEKEDEAPTSKHQAPEKDQSSNTNEDDTVEKEIETAGGAAVPDADNLQPLTCDLEHSTDPEPSAEGSMTVEQADKVASEWRALARRNCGPFISQWDVAELSAYLSGKPRPWYSLKSYDLETMHPPLRDPRFNPASPWCKVWPHIKTQVNQNEKN